MPAGDELVEIPHVGIGYRRPFSNWVLSDPDEIDCVEITAEHFFDGDEETLRRLSSLYPVYVHGLGLSLGTPGPLDEQTLGSFCRVVESAQPAWISEHIAFTRSDEIDLGHLNPVPCTEDSLRTLIDHSRELMDRCRKPLALENITSFLQLPGEMPETEFINRLCDAAGTSVLLDVTNLLINSRNHDFDPLEWFNELESKNVLQLHIVGYSIRNGVWEDHHADAVQDDLLLLMQDVVARAPVQSIILERDVAIPPVDELAAELCRLGDACEAARSR